MWIRFMLQVAPSGLLAAISMLAGLWFGSYQPGRPVLLIAGGMGLLLYIALMTFKSVPTWNSFLLTGLGFVLGVVVRAVVEDVRIWSWIASAGFACLLFALSGRIGRRLKLTMGGVGIVLWLLAWAYFLGWAALAILKPGQVFLQIWAGAGVFIFSGLAAAWLASLEPRLDAQPGAALGVDFFFLLLSLTVVIRTLLGGFA